jgi:hypothetical protein
LYVANGWNLAYGMIERIHERLAVVSGQIRPGLHQNEMPHHQRFPGGLRLRLCGGPLGGLALHGPALRGAPLGGLGPHGRALRGAALGGLGPHGRGLRGAPAGALLSHGRGEGRPPGLSPSRRGSVSPPRDCDRFLNRSRGSRWSPPGLQSRPRFSSGGFGARCAACASAGDSHSRPRANHFMTTSAFFRRS